MRVCVGGGGGGGAGGGGTGVESGYNTGCGWGGYQMVLWGTRKLPLSLLVYLIIQRLNDKH